MEIQGVSRQTLNLSNIIRAQNISGRIALPIKNNSLFSNFKHIKGIMAPDAIPAFSLTQLRRLDNLIDKLKSLSGEEIEVEDPIQLSAKEMNQKIEDLSFNLHNNLNQNNPYKSNIDTNGILINFLA